MTILDNQEVNADILNGIAKDLGCPEFSSFSDGVKFGVDKLNEITAALVTPGVLGTDGDSCKVTIVGGKISVGTGTIVFESGAKMKITENQVLEMVPDVKTYVVAVNDTTNNRMLLYNSGVLPDEDDYVLLAEVLETGEVIDDRAWATAKVAGEGGPVYERFHESVECIFAKDYAETISKTVKLARSGYHALYIPTASKDFNKGKCVFLSLDGEGCDIPMKFADVPYFHQFRLVYDGKSTLKIYSKVDYSYGSSSSDYTAPVPFDVYFF